MRFVLFYFITLVSGVIYAQDKVEIERSVKVDDVPKIAVKSLNKILGDNHKVKWYYQEDGNKKVYESKFEFKSKDYSVEFDTNGIIYNVEIKIDFDQINAKTLKIIEKKLNQLFEDYKVRKTQIEYLGDEDDLFELISEQKVDDDLNIQYEIEAKTKSSKQRALFELIFDSDAKLVSKRKIKLKSTDILDY